MADHRQLKFQLRSDATPTTQYCRALTIKLQAVSCRLLWKQHKVKEIFVQETSTAFRLASRLPHCRFDGDFCTTAQASLAAEGWPSGKQRQANRSITLPLCPQRQMAGSWILFNSGAMPLGDKAKAALPLRAATLKQQAMITRQSGKRQASLKPALITLKYPLHLTI